MIFINYILVCIIFGTTFLFIKVGIDAGSTPILSGGVRFMIAGLLVLGFFAIKKHPIVEALVSKQLILVGFCITFMTFSTLYWAEQYITSGLAAVLSATGPMMILLIQRQRKEAELDFIKVSGLMIALVGVICISLPGLGETLSYLWVIGCIVVLIGEVGYGYGTVFSKRYFATEHRFSPFLMNGVQMFYGGIMLTLFSFLVEDPSFSSLVANSNAQIALLYLILVGSIGGHGLYYWLISKTNPIFPSTWLYVSPLIAIFVGYMFLQEALSPIMILGAFLIILGVVLTNRTTLMKLVKNGEVTRSNV
ncbi:DMT family transporter [Pseudalkalibacillus salsuginis]|uniref:DMT family transporter n=1 Tax=Pseudalkalibacillus salsuginis TaxID=2910972 RepID=UPI001F3B8FD4|nr:EamA family transporter [Pseudalkalibacillus salsuginis]MCF6411464.1 EamA family transporter [Pseudalkalibacillus salsuginis]